MNDTIRTDTAGRRRHCTENRARADHAAAGALLREDNAPASAGPPEADGDPAADVTHEVFDNISGQAVRTFENKDEADWLCRGLNLRDGPGGRYKVRPVRNPEVSGNERKLLRLITLLTEYAEVKFGEDEWRPDNAEPYLGAERAAELDRLLDLADRLDAAVRAEPAIAAARPGQ